MVLYLTVRYPRIFELKGAFMNLEKFRNLQKVNCDSESYKIFKTGLPNDPLSDSRILS